MLEIAYRRGSLDCLTKLGLYVEVGRGSAKDNDDKGWGGPALAGGLGLTIPAAVAHYGGKGVHNIVSPMDIIRPEGITSGREFIAPSARALSDTDFLHHYLTRGAAVSANTVADLKGSPLGGAEFIKKLRGNALTKALEEKGYIRPFTEESKLHYDEFAKGPASAYAQIGHEVLPELKNPMMGDVLGSRYHAIRAHAGSEIDLPKMREAFAEQLGKRTGASPEAVKKFVEDFEWKIYSESPETYFKHMAETRAGRDASHLQNEMFSKAVGGVEGGARENITARLKAIAKEMGHEGEIASLPHEVQSSIVQKALKDESLAAKYINLKLAPAFRKAHADYGSALAPLLSAAEAVKNTARKSKLIKNVGTAGLAASGLLAGAGVGKMIYDKVKKKED